jgi:hypothetical protein
MDQDHQAQSERNAYDAHQETNRHIASSLLL